MMKGILKYQLIIDILEVKKGFKDNTQMEKGLLSIIIITRNSADVLPKCLKSIQAQSYKNTETIIIDNGSQDKTKEIIAKSNAKHIFNEKNEGFSRANNQALALAQGEYILFLNSDATLEKDFAEKIMTGMGKNADIGSCCGKILRPDTNIIDSAGFNMENWRLLPRDRGEGETDKGQFDNEVFVFGSPCAACVYRHNALDSIKLGDEYLDEDFFAYYEDVDLAWRVKNKGWETLYVPGAVAYHKKSGPKQKEIFIQIKALTNRYWCYIKNESLLSFLLYAAIAIPYEIIRVILKLCARPKLAVGYFKEWKLLAGMLEKRLMIRQRGW